MSMRSTTLAVVLLVTFAQFSRAETTGETGNWVKQLTQTLQADHTSHNDLQEARSETDSSGLLATLSSEMDDDHLPSSSAGIKLGASSEQDNSVHTSTSVHAPSNPKVQPSVKKAMPASAMQQATQQGEKLIAMARAKSMEQLQNAQEEAKFVVAQAQLKVLTANEALERARDSLSPDR